MLLIFFMVVLNIVLGNLVYVVIYDSGFYSIVLLIVFGVVIIGLIFVVIDLMCECFFGLFV